MVGGGVGVLQLNVMCEMIERERDSGQLDSGHAKEEGAALVTSYILTLVNIADTPSYFECQHVNI